MNLGRHVKKLIPKKTLANIRGLDPGFLVILSSGTKCHICEVDIGGRAAQIQLQMPLNQNNWNVE